MKWMMRTVAAAVVAGVGVIAGPAISQAAEETTEANRVSCWCTNIWMDPWGNWHFDIECFNEG